MDTTQGPTLSLTKPMYHSAFKLEWAEQNMHVAGQAFQEWGHSGGLSWREEQDATGHRIFASVGRLPRRLPMAVGTAIHSMRSSLDAAVATLFEGVKGTRRRVSFPFHEREEILRADFEKSGKHGPIKQVLPELAELVLEDFRPWREGNEILWLLNRLDNVQKHQCLPIIAAVTEVVFDYDTTEGVWARNNLWKIPIGREWIIAESRGAVVYSDPPRFNAKAVIKGDGVAADLPFDERDLFPLLAAMYNETERVLLAIQARFEDHPGLGEAFGQPSSQRGV